MRLSAGIFACVAVATAARVEPVALSMHPFTGQTGSAFTVTVRGNGLKQATSVFIPAGPLRAVVEHAGAEKGGKQDEVRVRIESPADAKPGRYILRLVTPGGVSNALTLVLTDTPVTPEPDGSHETPAAAITVDRMPVVYTGRILKRGETDLYAFDAKAGESLSFEAISGLPAPGAPGGNARGFDPSLSIWEQSGSWFDASRLNRIAFNDEPLWIIGNPTDALLAHKFRKSGRYLLRIEAFSGQGGPDYSYQLRIVRGAIPADMFHSSRGDRGWSERTFTRVLAPDRMNQLAERGGKPKDQPVAENYAMRPAADAAPAPLFKLPAMLEGTINEPGAAFRARFEVDGPKDVAFEIETPIVVPPLLNPVLRILNEKDEEVATNLIVGRGACTGAMTKGIQAKAVVPIRDPGTYTVEVRDAASDISDITHRFRLLVRPRVPHVGDISLDTDHINLVPGETKTFRVVFDREEEFQGAVMAGWEGLPPGISLLAGADFEPDKDPPAARGKRERFTGRTERSVMVLSVADDAPVTAGPVVARIVVRPVVDGKAGAVIASKSVPLMVVGKE